MSLFIDTSAILAYLDADQARHEEVVRTWKLAVEEERALYTSNYVLVESFALTQRRLGLAAARGLADSLVPLITTLWIDEEVHEAALSALFTAARRGLSLVDCTSFELMRRHGLTDALVLDEDFARQGFAILPDL